MQSPKICAPLYIVTSDNVLARTADFYVITCSWHMGPLQQALLSWISSYGLVLIFHRHHIGAKLGRLKLLDIRFVPDFA